MPELPRGTVTFLFTDIEGSTRLWQAHPDAMGAAIARHDEILRMEVEGYDGVVFKTVGDAICAAFASAPQAVRAARSAQRTLARQEWGATGPLQVRMAVHSGEADARDGDYMGQPLNRVARLLAAGHGGQILLSAVALELTRDALPTGASVRDLGEHRLRDLYRPERIFQLLDPALPAEFPPLKSLDARPHNLPLQPTPLVGREREVAEVVDLLRRAEIRLVTLTGPGGTGKTRLALQVAADVLDAFMDGVWFVDLAALTDPTLVPGAIAGVLGVREDGGRALTDTLADFLRDRHLLLVLDNLEQVVAAATIIASLMAAAPGLKVLTTSRVRLGLRGEHEVAVPPLELPDPQRRESPERLTQYAAVRLFVQRAAAAKAGFVVTNETAPAVAEICVRLDGLPLAIELAAARVKLFPPEALLKRLDQRLHVLTGGARDLPARQRTLRDTIAWSHDLLSEAERTLFRRSAVFAGGMTFEAIEAVANPEGDLDVFDALAVLVDQSLVRQTEGAKDEPRFGLLETIREFGLEQLAASGEAKDVERRAAQHFLHLADAATLKLVGAEQGQWLNRLETEHDNLRAALEWFLTHGAVEEGLRLAGALPYFWDSRGYVSEGRRWLDRALAAADRDVPPAVKAKARYGAGELAVAQRDFQRAMTFLDESRVLFQVAGDEAGVTCAIRKQGTIFRLQDDPEQARLRFEEALVLSRRRGDTREIALSLNGLGALAADQGRFEVAMPLFEEALSLLRELGATTPTTMVLVNLGQTARRMGDHHRAMVLISEALTSARRVGDTFRVAVALFGLAELVAERGDERRAIALLQECLVVLHARKDWLGMAEPLVSLAKLAEAHGPPERTVRLLGAAAMFREAGGLPAETAEGDQAKYLRAVLGEAAYSVAWEAGRALTLVEAVTEALALSDEVAVEPDTS